MKASPLRRALEAAKLPALLVVVGILCATTLAAGRLRHSSFVTWQGIGPDKWASVWLIRRHIDPLAPISFVPVDASIGDGTAFDIDLPSVPLRRDAASVTYEKLLATYGVRDAAVLRLGALVRDMEMGGWSLGELAAAKQVELAFRGLQQRHGREAVPFACYLQLFDRAYAALSDPGTAMPAAEALLPPLDCGSFPETASGSDILVPELPVAAVLAKLAAGQDVRFVDAREPEEFRAFRIPGAVNLRLREVDREAARALAAADLVVTYCIKDFRGYEVARALRKLGVGRVAILNPYGIRGWRAAGLPVAGAEAGSEEEGLRRLMLCANDPRACPPAT